MIVRFFICQACGAENEVGEAISRRDVCQSCGADLRACRQCRHYDTSTADDCREPLAEPVPDKEKANFCDFYQPARGGPQQSGGTISKSEAEKKWEELFAKK